MALRHIGMIAGVTLSLGFVGIASAIRTTRISVSRATT